jgi:hypothetical protein
MPDDEKDRFGDKLRDAEKAKEDTFFAERDRALLAKLKARTAEPADTTPHAGRQDDAPETRPATGWLARLLGRSR